MCMNKIVICLQESKQDSKGSKAGHSEASVTASDHRGLGLDRAAAGSRDSGGRLLGHHGSFTSGLRGNSRARGNGGTGGSGLAGGNDNVLGRAGRGRLGVAVDAARDGSRLVDGSDGSEGRRLGGRHGLALLAARHASSAVDDLGDNNGHGNLRARRLDILASGRNRSLSGLLITGAEGRVRGEDLGGDLTNRAVGDGGLAGGDGVDASGRDGRGNGRLGRGGLVPAAGGSRGSVVVNAIRDGSSAGSRDRRGGGSNGGGVTRARGSNSGSSRRGAGDAAGGLGLAAVTHDVGNSTRAAAKGNEFGTAVFVVGQVDLAVVPVVNGIGSSQERVTENGELCSKVIRYYSDFG